MVSKISIGEWVKTSFGLSCLVGTLLLMSSGVSAVRADEAVADAEQVVPDSQPLVIVPARKDGEVEMAPRTVDPAAEAARGSVVLNTRGYNYGPNRPTARPVRGSAPAAIDSSDAAKTD